MSDSELAVVVAPQTFPTPILIERAGPSTRKKFFEFFTVYRSSTGEQKLELSPTPALGAYLPKLCLFAGASFREVRIGCIF